MGWTASLDMGSEKMVMALASGEGSVCHLKGIKIMASQGIEHGVIKDKEKVRMCIRSLMSELMKDREIEVMNVALSGAVLRIVERRIVVPIQKKVVEQSDLFRAEQRCIDAYGGGQDEVVDILPVGYAIDRGEMIADPLGRSGRNLEVTYQVYLADYDYLADIQGLFEGSGIQEIEFYPAVRAYAEALDVERAERAAETYERARLEGYPADGAQELAMDTLLRGLHYSRYAILREVVENEFADEVPEEKREAFVLKLLPLVGNVFSVYDLSDDNFALSSDYDLLYTELTGATVLYLDEYGV